MHDKKLQVLSPTLALDYLITTPIWARMSFSLLFPCFFRKIFFNKCPRCAISRSLTIRSWKWHSWVLHCYVHTSRFFVDISFSASWPFRQQLTVYTFHCYSKFLSFVSLLSFFNLFLHYASLTILLCEILHCIMLLLYIAKRALLGLYAINIMFMVKKTQY